MNLSELKQIIKEEVEKVFTPHLEKIEPNEMETVLKVGDKAFGTYAGFENVVSNNPIIDNRKQANWEKSIKLVLGNEIIGFYLLSDKQTIEQFLGKVQKMGFEITVNNPSLLEFAKHSNGVEGLVVGILPQYKGKGYSRFLFDYPKTIGVSYIWAVQTKGMSNLEGWLKRAKLVLTMQVPYSKQEFYITVEKF